MNRFKNGFPTRCCSAPCLVLADQFICLVRPNHPALAIRTMDLENYIRAAHVFVGLSGITRGEVDDALARIDRRRNVAVSVTNLADAARFVARFELIATLSRSYAQDAIDLGQDIGLAPPFPVPMAEGFLWWHRHFQEDAGHR